MSHSPVEFALTNDRYAPAATVTLDIAVAAGAAFMHRVDHTARQVVGQQRQPNLTDTSLPPVNNLSKCYKRTRIVTKTNQEDLE